MSSSVCGIFVSMLFSYLKSPIEEAIQSTLLVSATMVPIVMWLSSFLNRRKEYHILRHPGVKKDCSGPPYIYGELYLLFR